MNIALFGSSGGVGQRLGLLAVKAGHTVRGLVRSQEQAAVLREHGIEPIIGDLLGEWQQVLNGTDAALWAAGAGAQGNYQAIDRDALIRVIDTLDQRGPRRLVIVSSGGVDRPDQMPPYLKEVLAAKAVSDDYLQRSNLDWTIVRPSALTDEPGTGRIQAASSLPGGRISRDDVAATLLACLETPTTIHRTFEITSGEQSIDEALAGLP